MSREEPHVGKSVTKIMKEVKSKKKRLKFPTQGIPDDLLRLVVECQDDDPEKRPLMTAIAHRLRLIRANPVITVKVVTQDELGSEAVFGYTVRPGISIPVLESATLGAAETGKLVTSSDGILKVSAHTSIGKSIQKVHDQVYLEIPGGFITMLDFESGNLLVEETGNAPIGPKRRVDEAKEAGYDSLLRVMRNHIACFDVCKQACFAINTLLNKNLNFCKELSNIGAIETICLVAREWDDELLLQVALSCLASLATPDTGHGAAMATMSIDSLVIKALQQGNGCRRAAIITLCNMTLNADNIPAVRRCCPSIINLLKATDASEDLLLPAWTCVSHIVVDSESQDELLAVGLAEVTQMAMTRHGEDTRFLRPLMAVIFRTSRNPLAENTFSDISGRVALALKTHSGDHGTFMNGTAAVDALSRNAKNLQALLDGDICETYSQLVKRGLDNPESLEAKNLATLLAVITTLLASTDLARRLFLVAGISHLLEALLSLAVKHNQKEYLKSILYSAYIVSSKPNGSLPINSFFGDLVKVLIKYPVEPHIVEPALFVLVNTLQELPESAEIIGNFGACEALGVLLANNAKSSHISDVCIQVICLACSHSANKDRFASVNARALVEAAVANHKEAAGLQNNAQVALAKL